MEKHGKLVLLLLVLVAVAVGGWLALTSGGGGGAQETLPAQANEPAPAALNSELSAKANAPAPAAGRTTVEVAGGQPEHDPEIIAALAKFTGRVVSHDGKPAPERVVRLFRFDAHVILQPGLSVLSDPIADLPDVIAGEATTGADGRFELAGAWPRSFYMLKADAAGPNPTLHWASRTPGPGETVDLGDIVLKNAAVATGIVVDESGDPVAGAMVRAADVPAMVAQFMPIEQFDPEGWLIVGERAQQLVIEMPPWAKKLWKELPVPTTLSGADGRFRLEGIEPAVNLIAATKSGFLSATQKNVKLDPGQVRDVGKLVLREGEIANGRVVDQQGKPQPDVQVVVGSRLSMPPMAFGRAAGKSNARGEFECRGLVAGDVVAAARRGDGEPWVVTAPQSIQKDIVVTLPSRCTLTVRLISEPGLPIATPRLRLLNFGGATGESELQVFGQLGFARAVPLAARERRLEDGRVQLVDLDAAKYVLIGCATDHAPAMETVDLTGDREVELRLSQARSFDVVVLDSKDAPIRNAAVYVHLRGQRREAMPIHAGFTGADGKVRVREANAPSFEVDASHPRYGAVAVRLEQLPVEPVVLRLLEPAALAGEVTEDGKPPELGKYMVMAGLSGAADGPISGMPAMTVLDADGKFLLRGLQPGERHVQVIKSLQAMRSFSSMMEMAMMARFDGALPDARVTLVSGQTAQVRLETKAPRVVDGPSAQVSGTVFVDGRPGEGMLVHGWSEQRLSAVVDAAGQFDLGQVKEGSVYLRVTDRPRDGFVQFDASLWAQQVEVKAGNAVTLRIDVTTGGLTGQVFDVEGRPASAVRISAQGRAEGAEGQRGNERGGSTISDGDGRFELKRLPAGRYHVAADADDRGRGGAPATIATGNSAEVRIQLMRTFALRGKLDRKLLPVKEEEERRWLWLMLEPQGDVALSDSIRGNGASVRDDEGTFEIAGLLPGRYRMRIHANMEGQWSHDGVIEVVDHDIVDFVVQPVREKPPPPQPQPPAKKENG